MTAQFDFGALGRQTGADESCCHRAQQLATLDDTFMFSQNGRQRRQPLRKQPFRGLPIKRQCRIAQILGERIDLNAD